MKGRTKLGLLLLAAAVLAAGYLAGALAPPVLRAAGAGPDRPALAPGAISPTQYAGLQGALDLLAAEDGADSLYLPVIRR